MYLGLALFFGVITYFIVAITPFVPKLRKLGRQELEYTMAGDLYREFDKRVDGFQHAMALAVGYVFYLLGGGIVVGFLSLLWPAVLTVLLIATIIFKTNKNK
jgi:hypothetical protein